jgi:hypothetical protein
MNRAKKDWMLQHAPAILAGLMSNAITGGGSRAEQSEAVAIAERMASSLYDIIERTTYVPPPGQW